MLFMSLSVAMVNSKPMHHDKMKEGKHQGMMKGGSKPGAMFLNIFGMMCEEENCEENAPKCLASIMPSEDIRKSMQTCRQKNMPSRMQASNRGEQSEMMKMMVECVFKEILESNNLEYIPDDNKANFLTMMEFTTSNDPEISEEVKNNMMMVVADDTCVMPTTDWNMKNKLQFGVCLMKTCVKAMADE